MKSTTRLIANSLAIALAAGIIGAYAFAGVAEVLSLYAVLVIGYVVGKIVLSEVYRHRYPSMPVADLGGLSCDVVVPFFNEDYGLLVRNVESTLGQRELPVGRIILVDDGSRDASTGERLRAAYRDNPHVMVLRLPRNAGKRHAMAVAFDHLTSPLVALVDSDTVLEPDALFRLARRLTPDVAAVTANIGALNRDRNWLTRLIDARYRNAFLVERAAQSVVGSVLCATGVLTVYRSDFLREVRNDWADQTFLGAPVQLGDDRRLTALALQRGRVIIALDARASTQVPHDPRVFLKQQLRWNKSFLRESVLAVRDYGVLTWPGLFSFLELFFWFFYLATIANAFIFNHALGFATLGLIWLAYAISAGLFRNITLIVREPRLILLAPVYSLLHVLILTPLRLLALVTIFDTRWGTR